MKKILVALSLSILSATAFCRNHHHHYHHRPSIHKFAPRHHHIHRTYHHYHPRIHRHCSSHYVGPFLGALTGTIVGNILTAPSSTVVQQTPTVVQTPVVVQQPVAVVQTPVVVKQQRKVWISGQYISQVQPNGTIIRVWQPGYWQITE